MTHVDGIILQVGAREKGLPNCKATFTADSLHWRPNISLRAITSTAQELHLTQS